MPGIPRSQEAPTEAKQRRRAAAKPTGTTSGERSAFSREALLSAARDLFTTRGYAATSIADIAAKAGTSVGLPYYYFGSKKQIFIALWSDYQAKQEARTRIAIAAARAAGETDGGRLLLLCMRAYLEGAWEARDLIPMMHGHDRPSGFDSVTGETNTRWRKRNGALLTGLDPVTTQISNAILLSSVGGICIELGNCRTDAKAQLIIECAMQLWTAVIERACTSIVVGTGAAEKSLAEPPRRS